MTTTARTESAALPSIGLSLSAPVQEVDELIIRPRSGWQAVDFSELWRFRELFWFLALRDLKVRYKQTALGALWAIIQPVMTMVMFSIFFGRLAGIDAKIPSAIPYSLFTLAALLPWQLFAFTLNQASMSIVSSRSLITKIYFPRLIIPSATLLCGLVDFAVAFGILAAMMAWYGVAPGWPLVALPFFVLLALLVSLAAALWLAALNAIYRDIKYVLPFLTQFWLLATPVAYPTSIVPEKWRWLYGLNPMVGVVEGFRWSMFAAADPPDFSLAVSLVSVTVLLTTGLFYFRRMERQFADVV